MNLQCPAVLIAAPGSGHGKTSITAAIARHFARRDLQVRCFKVGPDFIDPTILMQASAQPVYNLDPWIMGVDHCRELLYAAAQDADLILIEGMMGLFDGEPCSADIATLFGVPILPVIDASSMAQTFGALAHGLQTYRDDVQFAGVIANRVASPRHSELLRTSLRTPLALSEIARSDAVNLPERHLGLQLAAEIGDLDARLNALADLLADTPLAQLPPAIDFAPAPDVEIEPLLDGLTIAVACDQAFCFLYLANLEWLQKLGAKLHVFSPLADKRLPEVDAIYLPGGYPELHAQQLAKNVAMQDAICAHAARGKPILAECGGMLYLADALRDLNGRRFEMLGLLPGEVKMSRQLAAIGSQEVVVDGAVVRGHTFHYSTFQTKLAPLTTAVTADGRPGEAVYQVDAVLASYLHWYFPSNPQRIARWLRGEF